MVFRHAVSFMVSRIGPHFPNASLRGLVYPIIQTMVERNITRIESHDENNELHRAIALLQKIQETNGKNMAAFCKHVRGPLIHIFQQDSEDTMCPKINHLTLKFIMSGISAGDAHGHYTPYRDADQSSHLEVHNVWYSCRRCSHGHYTPYCGGLLCTSVARRGRHTSAKVCQGRVGGWV
jgi:hypothetical protein